MSGERPGEEEAHYGSAGRALSTSTFGNSTAFGFSLTMTGSFGMITTVVGTPEAHHVLLFAFGAAVAIGLLEGAITRGFRVKPVTSPAEVHMLGTALNFASVLVAVGVALGLAEALGGKIAWPICAFGASTAYVFAEAAELWLAERIQEARGDPHAEAGEEKR